MRKTKIVATLGPATDKYETIIDLIKTGVNVFRLNFSHATHEYHKETIDKIRKASKEIKKEVAILQDISGPKIRISILKKPIELQVGDILTLSKDTIDEDNKTVTLSYPSIIDNLNIGEYVFFADGIIRAKVISKDENSAQCEITVAQTLQSRKGANFPDSKLNIETITPKDVEDIKFGAQNGVDIVALSFVSSSEDIKTARKIMEPYDTNPLIFPKIEKPEAIENLDSILEEADGAMVARGDLGVELGVERVPAIQKEIIKKANELSKPTITATQMLTSMINSPYPTRAEVSDIANAVLDGSDAVMLSDETTVGKYPIEAIEVLHNTIIESEKVYDFYKDTSDVTPQECVAAAISTISKSIQPDALISFTRSGKSAMILSKFRPNKKIYASSYDIQTLRKLQVVWGVEPIHLSSKNFKDSKALIADFLADTLQSGITSLDKKYVLGKSYPLQVEYSTNEIKILDRASMEHILKKVEIE
jgi:pyruvate kinase